MADVIRAAGVTVPEAELTWRYDTPGGPGGQHANRTATRVELSFDAAGSPSLDEPQRQRIVAKLGPTVTVVAADTRSQARNRKLALDRLASVLAGALAEPRSRRRTRPTRSSQRTRVDSKRRRGETKRLRGRVQPDD